MIEVTYTKDAQTRTLEVPGDVWKLVDHVRGKLFPDVQPSMSEPAYLRALEIARKEK